LLSRLEDGVEVQKEIAVEPELVIRKSAGPVSSEIKTTGK
jgi:hypothetical protein